MLFRWDIYIYIYIILELSHGISRIYGYGTCLPTDMYIIIYLKSMILPLCVPMKIVMDQNIINEYGLHVFHWGFILNPRSMIFWLLPSSWQYEFRLI